MKSHGRKWKFGKHIFNILKQFGKVPKCSKTLTTWAFYYPTGKNYYILGFSRSVYRYKTIIFYLVYFSTWLGLFNACTKLLRVRQKIEIKIWHNYFWAQRLFNITNIGCYKPKIHSVNKFIVNLTHTNCFSYNFFNPRTYWFFTFFVVLLPV